MKKLEHWKIIGICLAIFDVAAAFLSYTFALWIRFDGSFGAIPTEYWNACLRFLPFFAVLTVAVLHFARLYRCIWRFAGFSELSRVLLAWLLLTAVHVFAITVLVLRMPLSYYIIGAVMQFALSGGIRFSYRLYLKVISVLRSNRLDRDGKRVMIIGAGEAGQLIMRDVRHTEKDNIRVVCFIDDNPNKWGRLVDGIPVTGGRDDILESVEKYGVEEILFAIPSATSSAKRDILNVCNETGCRIRVLPGFYQFTTDEITLSDMKDVAIEDLLGRDPIRVDMSDVDDYIWGKTIMVTGGGGSIGSELCRQLAERGPGHLLIFDIYENNAYDIEQELRMTHPELRVTVLIGSVRDSRRLQAVFERYRPRVVYHAAAHKHVPLMETSPCEAIKNNTLGTYKTAVAALKNGCERFVLISTDKAVNPVNIMGASKRMCEMVVQSMDALCKCGELSKLPCLRGHREDAAENSFPAGGTYKTEFVAVRFGNVLGSNGSVIPLFKKQIERGGPVTVTHPDIIRYFMTISEAVSLVLKAGASARGGEIFVLDMGEPVKIDTLARNLIKFSGFRPGEDIEIVYTGLRPGEKLYEEKLMAEEGLMKTANDRIHVAKPIHFDTDSFLHKLTELAKASYENDESVVALAAETVPTFHPEEGGRV